MDHKGILSSAFNMSLGFIPVIISILLCEFITQDTAIYIGTVIGIVGVYLSYHRKGILLPNFILYISAGILILLSLAALIPGDYVPEGALPLTLEVSILIPMLILYMHKKRFINHFLKQIGSCNKRLYAQGAEAAVVSARIALIFGILHFIIISIVIICQNPLSSTSKLTLYKVLPPIVFVMSILFNQIAIRFFNHLMSHTEYVPIVNTKGEGQQSGEDFWVKAEKLYYTALIAYIWYEAPEEEQNFAMVMEMLRAADVREDMDEYTSPLDELFERLEMRDPDHIAVKYYKDYHSGSAKTLKSIQITLAARLEKFNLSSLAALTATDELDLPSLGEKKVALFALIPDNDTSFNFLVSILYTQLFQQLFYLADHKYGGSLPVPVHFLMNEFSNVSLPEDFSKILAVMRSRNVYVSIILQNVAALKALFEKEWESILGNCDEFLYLGGNETSTHKLISESYLGKSTIDTNTYGKSSGRNGNYSTNYQISGRELLTPDEVRMLDNRYALLFIRGERPVMDEKYDILKHPNIALTEDGGAAPYEHGGTENAVATLSFAGAAAETLFEPNEPIPDYELLSDEDIEALFNSIQGG